MTMTPFQQAVEQAWIHLALPSAEGERCRICWEPATHKVEEVCEQARHGFTAYVCCEHFGMIMGPMAQAWCESEDTEGASAATEAPSG